MLLSDHKALERAILITTSEVRSIGSSDKHVKAALFFFQIRLNLVSRPSFLSPAVTHILKSIWLSHSHTLTHTLACVHTVSSLGDWNNCLLHNIPPPCLIWGKPHGEPAPGVIRDQPMNIQLNKQPSKSKTTMDNAIKSRVCGGVGRKKEAGPI